MRSADLQQITSQFLLRRTQQVLKAHLPPKIECVVFCRPTAYQVKLYHSLLNSSCVRSLISSSSVGQNHLGFIQAMRRLCNHPSLFTTTEFQESQVLLILFPFFFHLLIFLMDRNPIYSIFKKTHTVVEISMRLSSNCRMKMARPVLRELRGNLPSQPFLLIRL
jgi:SNF2 family DNA or RNA helicase